MSSAVNPLRLPLPASRQEPTLRAVLPQPPPTQPTHLHAVEQVPGPVLLPLREEATLLAPGLPPLSYRLIGKLAIFAYETVEGIRHVGQLSNWVSAAVARELAECRALNIERRSLYHDNRRVVPTVRRVRAVQPTPGVAEAAVILNTGNRSKAIALRLEGVRGYWQASSITVL